MISVSQKLFNIQIWYTNRWKYNFLKYQLGWLIICHKQRKWISKISTVSKIRRFLTFPKIPKTPKFENSKTYNSKTYNSKIRRSEGPKVRRSEGPKVRRSEGGTHHWKGNYLNNHLDSFRFLSQAMKVTLFKNKIIFCLIYIISETIRHTEVGYPPLER